MTTITHDEYRTVNQVFIDEISDNLKQQLKQLDTILLQHLWADDFIGARRYLELAIEKLDKANE